MSRTCSWTSAQAAALLLPLPLAVPVVPQLLTMRQQQRRRRRVRQPNIRTYYDAILTHCTEKEESDEDMGFGLFD
jgi:hypothetical protein